jgi:hypothetical protein
MRIWQGPKKKERKVTGNTTCRNAKSGFYYIYKILGMNRSFRRLNNKKRTILKHRQTAGA